MIASGSRIRCRSAGRPEASASSKAGANCLGASRPGRRRRRRRGPGPRSRGCAARCPRPGRDARAPGACGWCRTCRCRPRSRRSASSYWTAVASSWPVIRKQPSPAKQTTGRSGWAQLGRDRGRQAVAHRARGRGELGAEAAVGEVAVGPDGVVAGTVGDDRVRRQPLAQPRHDLAQLQRARDAGGRAPGQLLGMRRRRWPRPRAGAAAARSAAAACGEARSGRTGSRGRPGRPGPAPRGRCGRGRRSAAAAARPGG